MLAKIMKVIVDLSPKPQFVNLLSVLAFIPGVRSFSNMLDFCILPCVSRMSNKGAGVVFNNC